VPKYRYKIFYDRQVKKDYELTLNNICMEQGYKIHAMEIMEDHVHLFLEFHPSTSLSKVVQHLKGGSSHRMFKLHPELKTVIGVEIYGQAANSFDPSEM
jgi:putative transposase